MKKARLVLVILLSLAALGCAKKQTVRKPPASGWQRPYILKMSTPSADNSPVVQGLNAWSRAVSERTGGAVEIQVYSLGRLGPDENVIEQAMQGLNVSMLTEEGVEQTVQGINVGIMTDAGRMAAYVKDIGIISMPYLVDSYEELQKLTESETFAEWTRLLDNQGIHIIAYNWYDGPRNFYTNRPVSRPSDLNGQRIRTPGSAVWSTSVAALGAIPVAVEWNDAYKAIQSKSLDGVEVQTTSAYPVRIWEVTKYLIKTEHFQLANFVMVGTKWWNSLPAHLRGIIEEECKAQAALNAQLVLKTAAAWEQEMIGRGITITTVNKEPFIQAAQDAYDELGFTTLRDKLWAEIGKH